MQTCLVSFWIRLLLFHVCTPCLKHSPSWNQVSHTWAGGLLAPFLSFPSCAFTHLFWSSHSSSDYYFPLQDLPAGEDFWTSVCGPRHREMSKALLLQSWDTLVKAARQTCFITYSLSGVLFKSEVPGKLKNTSVVLAHGLNCSGACGIFPDQGSNPRPLLWQADS